MTGSIISRRTAIGLIGAGALSSPAFAAARTPGLADASGPYQVPGGRIGFVRPQGVAPSTNGWILQSEDHTFQVRVQETVVAPGAAHPMWDASAGRTLVSTPPFAGFAARRFKDTRYEPSADYGHDSIVVAVDGWIGEIAVSTSNLDDLAETAGMAPAAAAAAGKVRIAAGPVPAVGLVARWKAAADLVLGSLTVRAAPPIEVALAEFGVAMTVAGLNPRFAGDKLILSAQAPRNGSEFQGAGIAHLALPGMSNLDYIDAEANAELFDFFKMTGAEAAGGACRGVRAEERRTANGFATAGIRAFGKRRQQEITAVYPVAERAAAMAALDRVFQSLRFLDEV